MAIRVLIVDDQALFRDGLRYILQGESQGNITVVGAADNGRQAVEMVDRLRPDVVLMDIRMPLMDGVKATQILHEKHPKIRIMVLTTFDDDELVFGALRCGATGYVLKCVEPRDLVLAVEAVHHGMMFVSPSVGLKLVDASHGDRERSEVRLHQRAARILAKLPALSLREAEVLSLASEALRNRDIAERLCISENTVKNHISIIYDKLGIHNRLQLITHVNRLEADTENEAAAGAGHKTVPDQPPDSSDR